MNARVDAIADILERYDTVHMLGLSSNPERDSFKVAAYLRSVGYRVIPVNPTVDEVFGERAYPDLASAAKAEPVRLVDVFRRGETLGPVVDEILGLGTVEAVWLQLGVRNPAEEERIVSAGISLVSDRCIKVEHQLRNRATGALPRQ